MMKKNIYLYVLLILYAINITPQDSKKWIVVSDEDDKIIYIDSQNIRENETQITVWSMSLNKKLKETDQKGRKIGKIVNQYLFNTLSKKYIESGSIVYDEIGRMIGNTTDSSLNPLKGTRTSKVISENKEIQSIYQKALEILGKEETKTIIDLEKVVKDSIKDSKIPPAIPVIVEKKEEISKEKEIVVKTEPVIIKNDIEKVDKNNIADKNNLIKNDKNLEAIKYDLSKEKKVKGFIYTDGNYYVVQKSSWKNKNQAESEVKRLKKQGLNAFYNSVELPERGGTWYRVRIGYFNTLDEAEKK